MRYYIRIALFLLLCTTLFVERTHADTAVSEINSETDIELSTGEEVAIGTAAVDKKLILSKFKLCVIFLSIIGVIGYFLKKRGLPSHTVKTHTSKIQLTEEKNLGQGITLLLMKVQGEDLLLSKQNGKLEFLTLLSGEKGSRTECIVPPSRVISKATSKVTKNSIETPEYQSEHERQHARI